jgi:hypothetical protein
MAQILLDQFLDVVSRGQTYNSESLGHRLHDSQRLASNGSGRSENGNLLQLKVLHFLAGSPSKF